MTEVRNAFLQAADASRGVLAAPQVGARWGEPSALRGYTIRGLAGHLVRGVNTANEYLAAPAPDGEPIAAAAYFARIPPAPDPVSEQQAATHARAEQMAAVGHEGLVARFDAARADLARLLAEQTTDRKVKVYGDQIMWLDDYLLTRIVEILVHTDDLALSVGLPTPDLPSAAADLALRHLLEAARFRGGDLAVLRAFSRRERDDLNALRVF